MNKQWGALLFLLHIMLFSVGVAAQQEKPRLFLYTENMPPFSYLVDNHADGINVALIRQLCQRLRLECVVQLMPWRRAFEKAQAQQYAGVFSTARTPSREQLFKWVGPISTANAFLFRLKGRTEINPLNLDDAKQFKVAVARGDVFEDYFRTRGFDNQNNLIVFADKADAVPLLRAKRIDLLVGLNINVNSWLQLHGLNSDAVEVALPLGEVSKVYLALNIEFPEELVQQMQAEVELMLEQGVLDALLQQYGVEP